MRQMKRVVLAAALSVAASSVLAREIPAPVAAPADWGKALAEDAQAFHDLIADSHPGPVDPENPAFKPLLEKGLKTALRRAKTADSYEDWYFALKQYGASFDDGHLGMKKYQDMGHVWSSKWPGFLTGQKDGEHVVMVSRDPAAPPLGAVLASCDGQKAEALAAERIGLGAGRWMLKSQRVARSNELFVDRGNPYVRRPAQCLFQVAGVTRPYDLAWRDLPAAERDEVLAAARDPRFQAPIELRPYGGRGFWVGLGSFESDASGPNGQKLTALQAEVESKAGAIRAADVVVFDLRGNNGGSSGWIGALARTVWGKEEVERRTARSEGVDWRVSKGNLAEIVAFKPNAGTDPVLLAWIDQTIAGLTGALARRDVLWRQAGEEPTLKAPVGSSTSMRARTYVLTDYGCASACLDAVDVLTELGAVQVGQETSADTLYMEIRDPELPSRRVSAYVPMKVYRGRARGANQTAVPAHEWKGALADTAGIEAWIAGIDAKRP